MKKYTIKDAQNVASERGGKCLSTEYINCRIKLKWSCKEGHTWETNWGTIQKGAWCPTCGHIRRANNSKTHTTADMHAIAEKKGGKFLSAEYVSFKARSKWQCEKGHIWETRTGSILQNKWCTICAHASHITIEEVKTFARSKNGKCLSKEYINSTIPLEWECNKGHRWKTSTSNVVRGRWCYYCARTKNGLNLRRTISEMRDIAESRGGKCLSKTYKGMHTHLTWQCADMHVWTAIPSSIKSGNWCPMCHRTNENKCRFIFEQLLNKLFPKSRQIIPPLELDGYSQEYRLAFEYQGEQHYKRTWFHKSDNDLKRQKERDAKKILLCQEKNIKLVVIPYWESTSDESLLQFIVSKLKDFDINYDDTKPNWSELAEYSSLLKSSQKIIDRRKGKLLKYTHDGKNIKLKVECELGHQWETSTRDIIKKDRWCHSC